jgi:hypothetical protein
MRSQRPADVAGVFQLAGMALAFAAIAVSVASLSAHGNLLLLAVLAVGAGGAGILVQYSEWERLGGREAVAMTNRWIRTGSIPPTVPRETRVPLLKERESRASKRWWFLVIIAMQIPLTVLHLFSTESATDRLLWVGALALWITIGVWTVYRNLRVLPVIRRLLKQASAPDVTRMAEARNYRGR